MSIEPRSREILFAPQERDIRLAGAYYAPHGANEVTFCDVNYKHFVPP
ncbi:MAG TPA: hypothetical protein VN643_16695 [Pyrinomonadaceae bacterium]|nr:hypothetical protein [Pyrinomonadaceae bacterium]